MTKPLKGWRGTVSRLTTIAEAPDRPEFKGVILTLSRGVLKATEALDRVLAAGTALTERKPTLTLVEASSTPVFDVDAVTGMLQFESSDGQKISFPIAATGVPIGSLERRLGFTPLPEGIWVARVAVDGVWSDPVSITVSGPGGAVLRTDSSPALLADGTILSRT